MQDKKLISRETISKPNDLKNKKLFSLNKAESPYKEITPKKQ